MGQVMLTVRTIYKGNFSISKNMGNQLKTVALLDLLERLETTGRQLLMAGNPAFEPLLITNSFSGQFLGNLFSSHPSTEERVAQLLKLEQELPKTQSELSFGR